MKHFSLMMLFALAGLLITSLVGCGGGSGSSNPAGAASSGNTGQVSFSIDWGTKGPGTRTIPTGTKSITIEVMQSQGVAYDVVQIANNPGNGGETTNTFTPPVGTYTVYASAWSGANGTGNMLAEANTVTGSVSVVANQLTVVTLVLDGVDDLTFNVPATLKLSGVKTGQINTIAWTDSNGNQTTVATSDPGLTFTIPSFDTQYATVSNSGMITALKSTAGQFCEVDVTYDGFTQQGFFMIKN